MNITDVMKLAQWNYTIENCENQNRFNTKKRLIAYNGMLIAVFDSVVCDVHSLVYDGVQYIDFKDPYNEVARLIEGVMVDETIPLNINDDTLREVDERAATLNLTRNQFLTKSIIDAIEKGNV